MSNSRRDRELRNGSDVPFKDFLLYLYQSASPSPASTREGSISRGYQYRDHHQQNDHHQPLSHRNQRHVAVAQSLERIQGKSKTQMLVEVGSSSSSPRKEAPSGSENKSVGGTTGSSGGSKIVIHHQQGVLSKAKKTANNVQPVPTPIPQPITTSSLSRRGSISPDKTKNSSVLSRSNSRGIITPSPHPKQPQITIKQNQSSSSTSKPNDNEKAINSTTIRKKEDVIVPPQKSSVSVTSVQNKGKIGKRSVDQNQPNIDYETLPVIVVPKKTVGRKSSEIQNVPESRNDSPSSYREVLGDFHEDPVQPVVNIKQAKNKSQIHPHPQKRSIVDHDRRKSEAVVKVVDIDTSRTPDSHPHEEVEKLNLNHLCVHPDHDLSFFKNFSASPASRSKSSLAEWSLIHGAIEPHQPLCPSCLYSHQYQFTDQTNGHNSSTHQICCNCNYQNHLHTTSKRHARSTPIALDAHAINNGTTKKSQRQRHVNGARDHFHLPVFDHQHLLDYEQFSEERGDSLNEKNEDEHEESKQNSQSDGDDEGNGAGNRSHSHTKQSSSSKLRQNGENLEHPMLRSSTSPLFPEEQIYSSRSTKANHVPLSNTNSSPTLGVNGTEENLAVALTPRRINTSAAGDHGHGMAILRKRGGGHDNGVTGPGSTTTTVTLKMDTNSMFMDTVYVNLKQDIDTGSSLKVYY